MDHKEIELPVHAVRKRRHHGLPSVLLGLACAAVALVLTAHQAPALTQWMHHRPEHYVSVTKGSVQVHRTYNLTIGARWLNLDGGRWRPMFVCNGESPCPTLTAREGDIVNIHVVNDLLAQLSIHWSGMSHRRLGFWNDGTGGLNQYPILPRGNWTSTFDTTDHWGLNWYADHSGAGVADGVYGMIWTAPSPQRPRPYSKITADFEQLRLIQEAEEEIKHVSLWNSDFRTVDWKLTKMKATGAGLYCYKSILVNGKGRVFCTEPGYDTIDGEKLDAAGCKIQPGFEGENCSPSLANVEVIETHGRQWIMLNLINVGFEHALKWSIDGHPFWIVADDAGFVEPQLVDTVYVTNGARYTILIKLDQEPRDYSVRIASTSIFQNLKGAALLRYPAKRYPLHGYPQELPDHADAKICLNTDSSVPSGCRELDSQTLRSFPYTEPPSAADKTLLWTAGSQPSKYMEHITEYYVNEKPWQLFRAAMKPVFFTSDVDHVEKPVQNGLPLGTVVDLIVQNTINETIPMYKHGSPTYRLASRPYSNFTWKSIEDALAHDKGIVDVVSPPRGVVQDLPPLGWVALRWKVDLVGATMFHAVKLRIFALGMAAPLLEGMDHSLKEQIPKYAQEQPHILFKPVNDGVLG